MRKELLSLAAIIGLGTIATAAYSPKQRDWIKKRDGGKCKAPFPHTEDTTHPLQVHHILPQGYLKVVAPEVCPDYPENGITLCRNAHEVVHPDVPEARHNYHQDTGSFGKLREQRHQLLEQKKVYWNTTHDRQMAVIALRGTRQQERTEPFPPPVKKKK